MGKNIEKLRLKTTEDNKGWKKWGPYLSDRQWGTVREDYSESGYAWGYFTHDMARKRAYRWGEDGIGGISDNKQKICFAPAFWNGKDPILKERLFGLGNGEGNHGEDVKEYYYYLDSTPTHSYMKMLYKYPINEFPYSTLVSENAKRSRKDPEFELIDTGIFDKDEYFDIEIEYAKAAEEDILIKIIVTNRSKQSADLHILPTLWMRNTWAWGYDDYKPKIFGEPNQPLVAEHKGVGNYYLFYEGDPKLLFCENETNPEVSGKNTSTNFFKDGINNYLVNGCLSEVNENLEGTKASLHFHLKKLVYNQPVSVTLRLSKDFISSPFSNFNETFSKRKREADHFYTTIQNRVENDDLKDIQRQAYAGLLWSKQFYYYNVSQWLEGDPKYPYHDLSKNRINGRNKRWKHLVNSNIISMPDTWEYPWYASWDLAFHCVPFAKIDASFAKRQLLLLLREYYMHPSGQIPAYEWSFSDVNPPVHAWGAWQVYKIDQRQNDGVGDIEFLGKVFLKLLMNFTWWVNNKDRNENNLFDGGFLGLDNIGVFDRSSPIEGIGQVEQADATSWMAMYSLNMLRIAIELAKSKPYYQEMASKFFEHFLHIAGSMNGLGDAGNDLWDSSDEFYYDYLIKSDGTSVALKVRSLVGLLPLFAVEVFSPNLLSQNPGFTKRLEHALENRPKLTAKISKWFETGKDGSKMLSLVSADRLKSILKRMLDENEFLSDFGIRALSKAHKEKPYEVQFNGHKYSINYIPGEADSSMFGGNSNWRGPIWIPVNFMIVESLLKFYDFYGDSFTIEFPTKSGVEKNLKEIALELSQRMVSLFSSSEGSTRTFHGESKKLKEDKNFKDHILFYEFFHGDTGKGLGASHQTGWTALISNLIDFISSDK